MVMPEQDLDPLRAALVTVLGELLSVSPAPSSALFAASSVTD
jgi:hypothetical protein